MFGFIRPVKSELRVREAERFQCVYCGLCHAIRARYGRFYTFFLSYDMTFVALLFESLAKEGAETIQKRCDASPVRSRKVLQQDDVLDTVADLSVLLTYHKIADTIADERGIKRQAAQFLRQMAHRAYQKARARQPQVDETMVQCLAQQAALEKAQVPSIDQAADPTARMLSACAPQDGTDEARVLKELFYHIGRWVYLIDACQDIAQDFASGNYNPIGLRFALTQPILTPIKDELEITLARSLAAVHAAFTLLPIKRDREILENIICLGLPTVTRQVLDGSYQSNGGHKRHGSL